MYINLTEDQLSTLLEALVDAQDDKLEEAKYTMDKEDKADLLAAAESFGDLRQDLYQQSEAEREPARTRSMWSCPSTSTWPMSLPWETPFPGS